MRHESVTDDEHIMLEEECGCAASNGFLKPANGTTILRH